MYLSPSFLWFTQAPRRAAGRGRRMRRRGRCRAKWEGEKPRRGEQWRKEGREERERVYVSKGGAFLKRKRTRWKAARATNELRGPNVPPPISSCRPLSLSVRKPFKVKLAWRISGQAECVSDRLQPTLTSPLRDNSSSFTLRAPLPSGPSHLSTQNLTIFTHTARFYADNRDIQYLFSTTSALIAASSYSNMHAPVVNTRALT